MVLIGFSPGAARLISSLLHEREIFVAVFQVYISRCVLQIQSTALHPSKEKRIDFSSMFIRGQYAVNTLSNVVVVQTSKCTTLIS